MMREYSNEDDCIKEKTNLVKSENAKEDNYLDIDYLTCLVNLNGMPEQKDPRLNSEKLIDDIIKLHNDPKGNKLLWNDNWQDKIIDRDLENMFKTIDEMVSAFGGLESYKDIVGENPYDPTEPVCGYSAQNIFKLMTEGEHAVDPVKMAQTGKINGNEFAEKLEQLNDSNNYIALINDHRLGHMFLIDIPSMNRERVGYIYQSDLGDGALPALKIADWLNSRGKESIDLNKLKKFLSNEFIMLPENEQRELIAELLDLNKDISNVKLGEVKKDKVVDIYLREYDINDFISNIEKLKTKLA
ncbi:cycle-inhibiting factor [Photorhabdus heterorhabditis]|uniref:Cycle-inhibiting factor n=1 Tax=Photorhabdus heterorhabditis TaxID=880156 RepID=A0A5B0WF12_9GAMM|nr:cycle-inhibiting factor [Photorhabdus heterorhabditis]KAA1185416.1 cycle-inhibiting factor [Photorhabdus heterorhabditis]